MPAPICMFGALMSSASSRGVDSAASPIVTDQGTGADNEPLLRRCTAELTAPLGDVEGRHDGERGNDPVHEFSSGTEVGMARAPSTAESACCWSSIWVTSNWNHAP